MTKWDEKTITRAPHEFKKKIFEVIASAVEEVPVRSEHRKRMQNIAQAIRILSVPLDSYYANRFHPGQYLVFEDVEAVLAILRENSNGKQQD